MEKFIELTGVAATLLEPNVNTDAILPAIWVLNPDTDLGEKLFASRRYDPTGRELPEFVLNQPPYRGARILISGPNFGCGSSREAAVWALRRFGIRCLIAPSYGDIFYENCFQNGVLPITLDATRLAALTDSLQHSSDHQLRVDLRDCSIRLPGATPEFFTLSPERSEALLSGLDAMAQLRQWKPEVVSFEARDAVDRPWIYVRSRKS